MVNFGRRFSDWTPQHMIMIHESKMESTNLVVTNVCHFSIINRVTGGFQNLMRTSPWWIDVRFTLRIFFLSHFHIFHHSSRSQIFHLLWLHHFYWVLTQRKTSVVLQNWECEPSSEPELIKNSHSELNEKVRLPRNYTSDLIASLG